MECLQLGDMIFHLSLSRESPTNMSESQSLGIYRFFLSIKVGDGI
jgi:hypothetical protein